MNKQSLIKIFKDLEEASYVSLYFVPATKNPRDETPEQSSQRHKSFYRLPESIQDKFLAEETSQKIQQIGRAFNLELLQMADISRAIRSYYFGELKLEDMPFLLAKEIPTDLPKAQEITRLVIEKIINDKSQEIAYQSQLENLSLSEAMKIYPELGEQLITSEKIMLKTFPEPVRPSIKNWLADYTFNLGFDAHSSIDRGNYVFHTQNTMRLSSADREKLAYILKAHDENMPVTVNKNLKQVVFPAAAPRPVQPQTPLAARQFQDPPAPTRPPAPVRQVEFNTRPENFVKPNFNNNPQRNTPIPSKPTRGGGFDPRQEAPLKPSFSSPQQSPQNSASLHNTFSYSSPQKLPYEKIHPAKSASGVSAAQAFSKASVPQRNMPAPQPTRPSQPKTEQFDEKPSPYTIKPMFRHEESPAWPDKAELPKQLPRNVVNLKDDF